MRMSSRMTRTRMTASSATLPAAPRSWPLRTPRAPPVAITRPCASLARRFRDAFPHTDHAEPRKQLAQPARRLRSKVAHWRSPSFSITTTKRIGLQCQISTKTRSLLYPDIKPEPGGEQLRCGEVCLADEVQRHHVQGGEPGVRWQEPCARQRAPTGEAKDLYVFPLRRDAGSFAASCVVGVAGAAGRRRSCARFINGAFRRGAPHRFGAVRDGAACEPARWRTTTQKELEQRGRTGTSRSPPCTGCCRTPTRDGSRMRRAAAGRQRRQARPHRRGSLRDGLAGRYSILNCHDGETAAVHAATAPAVCSPSTRSTPPARLIVETRRAD